MGYKRIGYLSGAPRVSTKNNSQTGGPRAHILGVINAFKKHGYIVETYIVGDKIPDKISQKDTVKLISKNKIQTFFADIVRVVLGLFNSIKSYNELKGKVDIVYERNSLLQAIGWLFKKKGIMWIIESNGIFFEEAKYERNSLVLTKLAEKIELYCYKKSDYVVCVSYILKNLIVEKAKISPDKVIVIPNGVDTEFFNIHNYKKKRIFNDFNIGFVGGIIDWQGLDLLIKAIEILKKENIVVTSTIIGDGPALEKLKNLVKKLNLEQQILFTGRVNLNEVPSYIASFDIGFSGQVKLKKNEMYHSPLKLYEYMSMSKPVIAASFDDAKNLIDNKINGYLFKSGDLNDLVRTIRDAYYNKKNLTEMGNKAREKIIDGHSWDARIKKLISYIEKI
jgi:glycosyltransferase involved in cell wall biosynthesis